MIQIPMKLAVLLEGCTWEQITLGKSKAKTFHLKGHSENQYLKIQPVDALEPLQNEMERLEWLQGKLSVPKVLYYEKDRDYEYILLSEI